MRFEVAKRASRTSTGVKQAHRPGALRQAAVPARTAQRGDIRQAKLSSLSIAQVSAGHPVWSTVVDARNVADEVGDHVHRCEIIVAPIHGFEGRDAN
jgi:hypothetical protein